MQNANHLLNYSRLGCALCIEGEGGPVDVYSLTSKLYLRQLSQEILHGIFGYSRHVFHISIKLLHFGLVDLNLFVVQEFAGG